MRRKCEIRLRGSGQFSVAALLAGVLLCSLASIAASGELLSNVSHANISGVLLSLCLLTVTFQARN